MSKINGGTEPKVKKEKMDMWWETPSLEELRALSRLTGKPMAEIIRTAVNLYMAKERPRLAKLAKLHAELLRS